MELAKQKSAIPAGTFSWRTMLTLLLVAVPWFCRDFVAASLEKKTTIAQEVLAQKDASDQRRDQAAAQRESIYDLMNVQMSVDSVEARQLKNPEKDVDSNREKARAEILDDGFDREEYALTIDLKSFNKLRRKVADLDGAQKAALNLIADNAKTMEEALAGHEDLKKAWTMANDLKPNLKSAQDQIQMLLPESAQETPEEEQSYPDEVTRQRVELLNVYDQVQSQLADGYALLEGAATKQRDDSSTWAQRWRWLAWTITAIGALSMGDWKKLSGMITGQGVAEVITDLEGNEGHTG
jgi:hypothetical protein